MEELVNSLDDRERAFIYDLYTVPGWREPFDKLVDAQIKFPELGRVLEIGCGTGGFALDLAARKGGSLEVVAVDESPHRIELARGKASIQKLDNLEFLVGSFEEPTGGGGGFDLVIADLSLLKPADLEQRLSDILAGLRELLSDDGQVVVKLPTRGSFDEFHSFFWQALLEQDMLDYSSALEEIIVERYTTEDFERLLKTAGFRQVTSVTDKNEFSFENGEAFLSDPLFANEFLPGWLSILGSKEEVVRIRASLAEIIDQESEGEPFDLSAKISVFIARR